MGFSYTKWSAKNFSTPPFFDHKSATKQPHKTIKIMLFFVVDYEDEIFDFTWEIFDFTWSESVDNLIFADVLGQRTLVSGFCHKRVD